MTQWALEKILGQRILRDTDGYLRSLARVPESLSRQRAQALIARLNDEAGPKTTLGETAWGEPISIPLIDIAGAHGLVTGGTGAGKTRFCLQFLQELLQQAPRSWKGGFGLIDPKGDLFAGATYLLARRIARLMKEDPQAAGDLRRRVVIIDFANRHVLSSYNILARWPNADADAFAANRSDLLLDLLPGGEKPSLGGSALLRRLILLLSDPAVNLPITRLNDILHDDRLRAQAVAACSDSSARSYFSFRFPKVPASTVAALDRRIDALFSSSSVRLTLSGRSAPDFRRLQDEGHFILIGFGQNTPRSIRTVLQSLLVSDVAQSVFCRTQSDLPFLWICDEAQNLFASPAACERMSDLLTMSRSFGSHVLCMMQNAATAVHDMRMLRTLFTNIRWAFALHGEPEDAAFLKSALPVTGRRQRPRSSPFEERQCYSLAEESAMLLSDIAHLPDRVGYLWLKAKSGEALKITTRELAIPKGRAFEEAVRPVMNDPSIGMRLSRKEYERKIAERDRQWTVAEESDLGASLRQRYRAQGGHDGN